MEIRRYFTNVLLCRQNFWSGSHLCTKDIGSTTKLKSEVGILRNVCIFEVEDVAGDS